MKIQIMNLKDKFSNYQPEFDEKAWEQFLLLKKKKERKRKILFWSRYGGICLVGIAMVVLFARYSGNIDGLVSSTNDKEQLSDKVEKNEVQSINTFPNINKTTPSNQHLKNTTALPIDNKKETEQPNKELNTSKKTTTLTSEKKILWNKELIESVVNKRAIPTNEKTNNNALTVISLEEKKRLENERLIAKMDKPIEIVSINSLSKKANSIDIPNIAILAAKPLAFSNKIVEPILVVPPIIKKHKQARNSFKLGVGYTDGFINGFTLDEDNPADKRGFAVQAAYYRNLSKLLGIGLSAGYVKGIDKENPQLAIKDKEVIQFLHLDLYFFLVNEKRHRLYGKIGIGPTKTDRILGTFYWDQPNNILERRFQINTLRSIGVLVEGGYEFKLTPKLWLGTNYSIISHNDGGWFAGLSVGHKF